MIAAPAARARGPAVALGAALAALALWFGTGGLPSPLRFDFLWQRAGVQIAEAVVPAGPQDSVWLTLLAGLLNTLLAAGIASALAIPAGIALALARAAQVRLLAGCATALIEAVRNTPVLLQLFLWYAVLTQTLPGPRGAMAILPGVLLCNRGLFLPWLTADGIDRSRLAGFNIEGGLSLSPELTALAGGLPHATRDG